MRERLFVRLNGDVSPGPETSAPAGTLVDAPVPAALTPYVTSIMSYREHLGDTEVIERVVPDGAVRLAFNFDATPMAARSDRQPAEAIGASTAPALVRLSGKMDGVAVTLRAGAAFALLGVPASELSETVLPLDVLWRREALLLRERLLEAPDDATRVSLLESALLARIARQPTSDHACAAHAAKLLTRAGGMLSVRELASAVGVGERRLQQLFHQHVGLSPRAHGRIARMHALLRALRATPAHSLARLALDAGYYDQSHLTNEFRALCGVSPGAFVARVSGSSKTTG